MKTSDAKTPNFLLSIAQCKCPNCRKGNMFKTANPYIFKSTLEMYEVCPECGLNFEPEVGFYFGTGYVSYGLCIAFTVASFLFTLFTLGFSIKDNSLFYWLGVNVVLLIIIQPVIMRLSRTIWLSFFTKYRSHTLV
jgi:hypothetical protein